jgi:hypothetical protein
METTTTTTTKTTTTTTKTTTTTTTTTATTWTTKTLMDIKLSSSWGTANTKKDDRELHRLISLVRDDEWNAVRGRLETHPHEALILDGRGRTCLMAAYAKSTPLPILQALLHKTRFGLETARDKTGVTALLIALQVHAPLESIQLLLSSCKGKQQVMTCNHHGNLPLHAVLKRTRGLVVDDNMERRLLLTELFLKHGGPQQILFENHEGHTPLHVALLYRLPGDIIELLVRGELCVWILNFGL